MSHDTRPGLGAGGGRRPSHSLGTILVVTVIQNLEARAKPQ